jgi:uncharacterized protein YegL
MVYEDSPDLLDDSHSQADPNRNNLDSKLLTCTSTRMPFVIMVDISTSMSEGENYKDGIAPIMKVCNFINHLYEYLRNDEKARRCVEIAVVTFGPEDFSPEKDVISPFSLVKDKQDVDITARGPTFMSKAINYVIQMINERKSQYKTAKRKYFRPLVLLITDGGTNTPDIDEFNKAKLNCLSASKGKHLVFLAVKVGREKSSLNDSMHFDMLKGFDALHEPIRLEDVDFSQLFSYLSNSIEATISNAQVDQDNGTANAEPKGDFSALDDQDFSYGKK